MENDIKSDIKTIFVKCCGCNETLPVKLDQICPSCFAKMLERSGEKVHKKLWLRDLRIFAIHLVMVVVPLYLTQYYFNNKVYFLCVGFYLLGTISFKFSRYVAELI